jgi:DNA-binding IclR family transcriptional regulator
MDDELSVREIAEETGIPKSRVHRLMKKIEPESLDDKAEGDDRD